MKRDSFPGLVLHAHNNNASHNLNIKGRHYFMKFECPYLISFKEYDNFDAPVRIYKCLLSNALLKSKDIESKWACGGCTIPIVLKDKPCRYLTPHKVFFLRGTGYTWYTCELLNLVMDMTVDFCKLNCKLYSSING